MSTYSEKLKHPKWQRKRSRIVERDHGKCCDCGSTKKLQVHHCCYIPGFEPWDYDDDLLITVCETCHQFRQGREQAAHVGLAKILRVIPPQQVEEYAWNLLADALKNPTQLIITVKMGG